MYSCVGGGGEGGGSDPADLLSTPVWGEVEWQVESWRSCADLPSSPTWGKVGRQEGGWSNESAAGPAGTPSTLGEGEARWQGSFIELGTMTDSAGHPCCSPHPGRGGGTRQRREERSAFNKGKQRTDKGKQHMDEGKQRMHEGKQRTDEG
jgi:hypothetical protein